MGSRPLAARAAVRPPAAALNRGGSHAALSRGFAAAAVFVLAAGFLPGQVPEPAPWSELEPALRAADAVVVTKVERVSFLSRVGATQVTFSVEEVLMGLRLNRKPLLYISTSGRYVEADKLELLVLRKPAKGELDYQLLAKFSAEGKAGRAKVDWVRRVVGLRLLPAREQGGAFVRFYASQIALPRMRETALLELERLRRDRPHDLRRLLHAASLVQAAKKTPLGRDRDRVNALLAWVMEDSRAGRFQD